MDSCEYHQKESEGTLTSIDRAAYWGKCYLAAIIFVVTAWVITMLIKFVIANGMQFLYIVFGFCLLFLIGVSMLQAWAVVGQYIDEKARRNKTEELASKIENVEEVERIISGEGCSTCEDEHTDLSPAQIRILREAVEIKKAAKVIPFKVPA